MKVDEVILGMEVFIDAESFRGKLTRQRAVVISFPKKGNHNNYYVDVELIGSQLVVRMATRRLKPVQKDA